MMKPCGKKCEIWSRVVGYMTPVDQWNGGKAEEYKDRREFKLSGDITGTIGKYKVVPE